MTYTEQDERELLDTFLEWLWGEPKDADTEAKMRATVTEFMKERKEQREWGK